MTWYDPPPHEQVYELYKKRAQLIAEIREKELDLEIEEKRMQKSSPRNTALRFLGENESLIEKRRILAKLKNELSYIEADIGFMEYWKEMFKSCVYMKTK